MKNYRKFIGLFYILTAFLVIPVYNKGTYDSLSQHKVEAFYLVAGTTLFIYFIISIIFDSRHNKTDGNEKKMDIASNDYAGHCINLGLLDVSMGLFLTANVLSTLLSGRIYDAFYGVPGFGMGLLSVLIMAISFFFISRNVKLEESVIHMIAIFSVCPVMLTIINRMGYDPLKMFYDWEDVKSHLYVSTFGNYSAYSGYLSIIIPIVCFMAFFAETRKNRLCYWVLLIIDLLSMFMAGTSAIVACTIITILIILIWRIKPGINLNSRLISGALIAATVAYVVCIFYGISNPDFANGRGFIWELSLDMFKSFSIKQKLFGVGPNCYMYFLNGFLPSNYEYLVSCNERFGNLALTSAHSEYIDYLINSGLFGLLSYVLLIYAAIKKYLKKGKKEKHIRLSFLCVVSYLFYVTVNFSSVLSTPFFFIFLGTLAYE